MDILSNSNVTIERMQKFAKNKNATTIFIALASLYFQKAKEIGVNPAVAYCQFGKESGWGKYSGVLNESFCNPCGLKTRTGGSNTDPNAHQRFGYWIEGISAHIDHLALYAGAIGYPKTTTFDPRHFGYLYRTAKTVEALSGKWAPSITYGTTLIALVKELEDTV